MRRPEIPTSLVVRHNVHGHRVQDERVFHNINLESLNQQLARLPKIELTVDASIVLLWASLQLCLSFGNHSTPDQRGIRRP